HVAREWTRRILVRGDRNHAPSADAADGRLDADEHEAVGWTENRTGRFRAHIGRPQARRRPNPGARSGDAHRGTAVGERQPEAIVAWPGIAAGLVRVHPVSADGAVVPGHTVGHPVG